MNVDKEGRLKFYFCYRFIIGTNIFFENCVSAFKIISAPN